MSRPPRTEAEVEDLQKELAWAIHDGDPERAEALRRALKDARRHPKPAAGTAPAGPPSL